MEGRLFEDGTTLRKAGTEIDQTTSGLNFDTTRPRTQVLKDYARVIQYIYNPKHYYERATYTALQLKPEYKYRPSFFKMIKLFITFLKLSLKVGFNGTTGQLYWKMVFTVLFKNPKAAEASINLAAMFIHFHKMSKFIIELADKEIDILEKSVKKEKIRV